MNLSRGIIATDLSGVRTTHLGHPFAQGMFGSMYLGAASDNPAFVAANAQPVSQPSEWSYPGDTQATMASGYTPPPMVTADGKVFSAGGSSSGGVMSFFSSLFGGAAQKNAGGANAFFAAQQGFAAEELQMQSQKRTTLLLGLAAGIAGVAGLVYFLRK